ncbi:hypothetical protein PLCT2_00184 [Planctomycetaceae bacterium]|nr:hypothetical protein PLCT2_00184 [Planctomycetaceae bacterium]
MKLDIVARCLFALAAVAGACFYGYDVMTKNAEPVYANAGLAGKEGFTVVSHTDGKGGNYLIVNTYAANPDSKSEMRRVMIVYEIKGDGEGKAKLFLVGSRCIEHDGYFDLLNFEPRTGTRPLDLKKQFENR